MRANAVADRARALEQAAQNERESATKAVFRRERPVLEGTGSRPHRLRTPRTSSFPSGHASAATVAVMMLGRRRGLLTRAALAVLGTVVASSRVHVRIHHPSDVVGGVAVGYVLGRVARRLLP